MLLPSTAVRSRHPLQAVSSNTLRPASGKKSAVSEAKWTVDHALESTDPKVLSTAFKCIYQAGLARDELAGYIKQHQRLVVRLSAQKLAKQALAELSTIYLVFQGLREFQPVPWAAMLALVEPLDLLSAPLVVSFHFFLVQALLHYVSSHLHDIGKNDLPINASIFMAVSRSFLLTGNFMLWMGRTDTSSLRKYHANCAKMLSGFLKVATFLHGKAPSPQLKLAIAALELKTAEFNLRVGSPFTEPNVQMSSDLEPFIRDFHSSLNQPSVSQRLTSLFANPPSDPVSEGASLNHILTMSDPDTLSAHALSEALEQQDTCPEELLRSFCSFTCNVTVSVTATSMLESIFAFIGSFEAQDSILELLDAAITYGDRALSDRAAFGLFLRGVLPVLSDILTEMKQTKRLKSLARQCFTFGKSQLLVLALDSAANLDLMTFELDNSALSQRLWAKCEYYICKLSNLGAHSESLNIASSYINKLGLGTKELSPKLVHSLTECIANAVDSNTTEFPLDIKPDLCSELLGRLMPSLRLKLSKSQINALETLVKNLSSPQHIYNLRSKNSTVENLEINTSLDEIYACAILLHASTSASSEENLAIELNRRLHDWQQSSDYTANDELNIFYEVAFLLYHKGFYNLSRKYIILQKKKGWFDNFGCAFNLEILLGNIYFRCGDLDSVPDMLSDSGKILKQIAAQAPGSIDYNDVMQWKLSQLEFYISKGDEAKCKAKYAEIKKFLSSKEEYNIVGDSSNVTVLWKLRSFLVYARFLFLTSKFQFAAANRVWSLRNSKLAIKLLRSVIRKLDNLDTFEFVKIKTECVELLMVTYELAFANAKSLGLLKEAVHQVTELKNINESLAEDFPLKYASKCFRIADFLAYASQEDEAKVEFDKGKRAISAVEQISLQASMSISLMIFETLWLAHAYRPDWSVLARLVDDLKLASTSQCHSFSDISADILILEYFSSLRGCALNLLQNDSAQHDRHMMILKSICSASLQIPHHDLNSNLSPKVQIIPTSSHKASQVLTLEQEALANRLLECKDILLQIASSDNISYLDVAQVNDVQALLCRCVCLLSVVTVMKAEGAKDLLQTLFYLKDRSGMLSYENHNAVLQSSEQLRDDYMPHIPSASLIDTVIHSQGLFLEKMKLLLPNSWSVVTVDICSLTGDLVLSRYATGNETPILIRVPFGRQNREMSTFKHFEKELNEIVAESNQSTKSAVTSTVKTKEDRKAWWKLRFSLDIRLKGLLEKMEKTVIGGFRGAFGSASLNSESFDTFKRKLSSVLLASLKLSFEVSDIVAQLFYHLDLKSSAESSADTELLDDLINYTVEQILKVATVKPQSHSTLRAKIKTLYPIARSQSSSGHVVLIPGQSCASFPWESMPLFRNKSISRVPSVHLLLDLLQKRQDTMTVFTHAKKNLFYVVNPGKDLKRTQERFEPILKDLPNASGILGEKPEENYLVTNLYRNDLFIYLGHGGGEQYMRSSTLLRAKLTEGTDLSPALLMGCSSGAYQDYGRLGSTGNVFNWLVCGSPMVVTNLWDVTDKDIDIFGLSLLSKWGFSETSDSSKDIGQAVAESRDACTLKYLNGAAPILHGLPLHLR